MLKIREIAILCLVIPSSFVFGQEAKSPNYHLKAPLFDNERTKVLVLATEHLHALGKDFDRAHLDTLIDGLERFGPDVVAVEAIPPGEIAQMVGEAAANPKGTTAQLLAAFADDAVRFGREAQESLGISGTEASTQAEILLAALQGQDHKRHRELALHFLAAYDLPSALLQWSYLAAEQRSAGETLTPLIAGFLSDRVESPNEIASIGVEVARRRGLNRLSSVDDHVDDELGLRTGSNEKLGRELEGNPAYAELAASPYILESQRRLPEAVKQGDLLPLFVRLNSPDFLNDDVAKQWHLFFRTELPSRLDRTRVAMWESRNLNIASRIRAASTSHPGGHVLVVIGAAHKPFLDRYLEGMMDIDVVQLAGVLQPRQNVHEEK